MGRPHEGKDTCAGTGGHVRSVVRKGKSLRSRSKVSQRAAGDQSDFRDGGSDSGVMGVDLEGLEGR